MSQDGHDQVRQHCEQEMEEQQQAWAQGEAFKPLLVLQNELGHGLQHVLIPHTQRLQEMLDNIQYEAAEVTKHAEAEREGTERELTRMTNLVLEFQSRVCQFLPQAMQMQPFAPTHTQEYEVNEASRLAGGADV